MTEIVVDQTLGGIAAAVVAIGIAAVELVLRPFVTPLSERWDRISGGGKAGGEKDAGDVPSGEKDQ